MLEAIRKYAHNPIFKIIFGVLIVAFAASGVAGMSFSAFSDNYVAKVGDKKITAEEVEVRFNQLKTSLGPQAAAFNDEQLAAMGYSRQQVLQTLVQGAIVGEEVKDLGILVGDEAVKSQIKKMPVFYGQDGKFSAERFQSFLAKMGYSEANLKSDMKTDLQNLVLVSAVLNNTPKNIFVAEEIAKAVKLKRDVEIISIPANRVFVVTNPSDKELADFYFENSFKYKTPETRDFSYIKFPKPNGQDKESFEKIAKIEDEIAAGSNIAEIASKFNLEIGQISSAKLEKDNKLLELAFKTAQLQVSSIVELDENNNIIVQVNKINESGVPKIEDVKAVVINDYKSHKQKLELVKFSQSISSELEMGKQMAEVAAAYNLSYQRVVDFNADAPDSNQELVSAIYGTEVGKTTGSIDDGKGGYLIAKVVSLKPQQVSAIDVNDALQQGAEVFQQEIFAQYMKYLEAKHPIKFKEQKETKKETKK